MEILYSPFFDSNVFLDNLKPENKTLFNKIIVGPLGLLGILEREFGLTGKYPGLNQRNRLYREVLAEIDSDNRFFHKSFIANPAKTTKEILRWRDELIMGGIEFNKTDDLPPRINDLCEAENKFTSNNYFKYAGEADRWKQVRAKISKTNQFPGMIITICFPEELMEPAERNLFSLLEKHKSVKIAFKPSEHSVHKDNSDLEKIKNQIISTEVSKIKLSGDGSIKIIHGSDPVELGYFMRKYLNSSLNSIDKVIVANSDVSMFSRLLDQEGLPSHSLSSNPIEDPVLQIIKLVPSCIWRPLNIKSLIEFLMLNNAPFDRRLARDLAKVVSYKPGRLSDDWNKVKEEWRNASDFTESANGDILTAITEIEFWFEDELFDEYEPLNQDRLRKRITELFNKLKSWANRKAISDNLGPYEKIFYLRLKDASEELNESIKGLSDKIVLNKLLLEQLMDEVIFSAETTFKPAERGSIPVINSGFNLIDDANELIYWNCIKNDKGNRLIWFPSEKKWFDVNNITYTPQELAFSISFRSDIEVLFKAKKLLILIPDSTQGEEIEGGNLYALLSGVCSGIHKIEYRVPGDAEKFNVKLEDKKLVKLPDNPVYWTISNKNLITCREYESYSSLKDLFYYPYAWVLNYVAKIRQGFAVASINEIALKGTISHRIIEKISEGSDLLSLSETEIIRKFDSVFDEVIEKEGAIFLLPEKRRELNYFKIQLEKAIPKFIKTCKNNGWTSILLERTLEGRLGDFNLKSRLDIILEKSNDKVVVDIKYFQAPHYEKGMLEDSDLQLILYAGLLGPYPEIARSAYYFVKTQTFLAKNNLAFKEIETVGEHGNAAEAVNREIWGKMEETAIYRFTELSENGLIEVGESHPLDTLQIVMNNAGEMLNMPGEKGKKPPRKYNDYINLIKVN